MKTAQQLKYSKHFFKNGLENYVKYAWVMQSQEIKSNQDLLIADGYPEIIFVLNGAYHKAYLNSERPAVVINKSCIIGIQTQSVLAHRLNNCHLVGLKLNPWGAFHLLGKRLKEIGDTNSALETFGVQWLVDLDCQLQSTPDASAAMQLLSSALLYQTAQLTTTKQSQLTHSFLSSILNAKGQISVQELAQEHNLGVRQFQRIFKNCFGLSPKKMLNLIRFKALYKSCVLNENPTANYLDFGYYDQTHFIKDFRKQLGTTPSKSTEAAFLRLNEMAKWNA